MLGGVCAGYDQNLQSWQDSYSLSERAICTQPSAEWIRSTTSGWMSSAGKTTRSTRSGSATCTRCTSQDAMAWILRPSGYMQSGRIRELFMFGSHCDLITADGINHGRYRIEDCVWCMTMVCEDGYRYCVLLWSGTWTCEDCMKILIENERRET